MEKANVTIGANVTGTNANSEQIIPEDKRLIHGAVFYKMEPMQFDKRIIGINHSTVTEKQLQEYLDSLPCSRCGEIGGTCGCVI